MHIASKPEKVEQTIKAVKDLAAGGNLAVEKVVMRKSSYVGVFGEPKFLDDPKTGEKQQVAGRMKDREELAGGIPVEFTDEVPAGQARVMLVPSDKPAPKAKADKPAPKAKK